MSKLLGEKTRYTHDNFTIGNETVNYELIKSIIIIKLAASIVNYTNGDINAIEYKYIRKACKKILEKDYKHLFPLTIWQCGSGTQINMNVNEVISNLANFLIKKKTGKLGNIDPIEHVNLSQSTNDVIPSAMNISIILKSNRDLLPSLEHLAKILKSRIQDKTIKLGRTHLQDATPLTVGQEFSGYYYQVLETITNIKYHMKFLFYLVQGGTCIGTGINTRKNFDKDIVKEIRLILGLPFRVSKNKIAETSSHDSIISYSGSLNRCAITLMKISTDIRYLSSGPVAGFGDYQHKKYEVGSSSMPGKVNPTQCEMMSIVSIKVMGIHQTISLAATHGNFQLNIFKPLILNEILNAIDLISKSCEIFSDYCISTLKVNKNRIKKNLSKSNVLITNLNPLIGYNKSAELLQKANYNNRKLKKILIDNKIISRDTYDQLMNPHQMIKPNIK